MSSKYQRDQAQREHRREWLERRTTEELLAALDSLDPTPIKIFVGDGGKTLVRQILAEREARSLKTT